MGSKSIQFIKEYKSWLIHIKNRLLQVQLKAAIQVNTEVLAFYWELGTDIVEKQKASPWGSGFLKHLSQDLRAEFPDMKGFSEANLSFIRRWVLFYASEPPNSVTTCDEIDKQDLLPKKSQLVTELTQIPWGHNREIISKCSDIPEALFYVRKTLEHNWSRNVLVHQMEAGLYQREGQATTNFAQTLPLSQSDLAQQLIKDPYNFDFLTLTKDHTERELEKGLIEHITKFLLELGAGFAYIGKQRPLLVGERQFFIDLLFYHTRLHCYVVIELKTGDFEPEYAGKLNFYLKAVDEQLKTDRDEPTLGILLCKTRDKLVVEYALSDIHKPIGVSKYQLVSSLPESLKSSLPTIEEIEAELSDVEDEQ